jgi:long-chain acyl-CoA synthetase
VTHTSVEPSPRSDADTSSAKPGPPNPQRTLAHVLGKACRYNADRIAVVQGQRHLTYAEMARQARGIAAWLHGEGLPVGARVGILSHNCLEFVTSDIACLLGGFTRVGLGPRLSIEEAAHICSDAGVGALFVDESWAPRAAEITRRMASDPVIVSFGAAAPGVLALADLPTSGELAPWPEVAHDAAALIAYTSGTTGHPKGAVISQRAAFHLSRHIALALSDIDGHESIVHTAPLAHFTFAIMLSSLCYGGTQYLMPKFDAPALLDLIEAERINVVPLVPTQLHMVVAEQQRRRRDVSSVRCIPYSSSPIALDQLRAAIGLFGPVFVQLYAQTEVPPPITVLSKNDHQAAMARGDTRLLLSAGRPLPYVDVRVVDEHHDDVPTGDLGEILCRSETSMDGYWNDPAQTAQAFGTDGWLATGDVGRLDADGYLSIVDRRKSLIISGGYNVYPAEVEQVIQQLPWVAEVVVVGAPDQLWGEAVTAVVVIDDSVSGRSSTALSEELIAHCRAHLAGYRVPKRVDYRTALPRNATGKVLTRLVRESYWPAHLRRV